jgi:hypothetical protein
MSVLMLQTFAIKRGTSAVAQQETLRLTGHLP